MMEQNTMLISKITFAAFTYGIVYYSRIAASCHVFYPSGLILSRVKRDRINALFHKGPSPLLSLFRLCQCSGNKVFSNQLIIDSSLGTISVF